MVIRNEEFFNEAVSADGFVIPNHTLSFAENALYIAEAIENDYNEMMRNIGIYEISVFESTGCQVVYEGEEDSTEVAASNPGKKSIKDTIIDGLKAFWEKIKAGFEKILEEINRLRSKFSSLSKSITLEDLKKLDNDVKLGEIHDFTTTKKDFDEFVDDRLRNNCMKNARDILGSGSSEEAEDKKKTYLEKICFDISGFNDNNVDEMKKSIKEAYLGEKIEVTAGFVKDNFNTMKEILDCGKMTSSVKKSYKTMKTFIDGQISEIKKQKEFSKTSKAYSSYLKSALSVANTAMSIFKDILKTNFNDCRYIFFKIANSVKSGNKAEQKQYGKDFKSAMKDDKKKVKENDKATKAESKRNKAAIKATNKTEDKGRDEWDDVEATGESAMAEQQLNLIESLFAF